MSEFQFLNIYSGTPPQGKASSNSEPALWNVYLNKKENAYLIQKLDGNNKPTAEKYKISPTYFGINFRQVNNSELKHAVDKNLGQLGVDKEKNESFLDFLFSSRSAFSATVQKSKNGKKKTGEFAFQTGKENQQSQRKKTDSAPAGNVPDKKVTNEFQFNLGAQSAEKASRNDKSAIKDFGLETLPNPEEMEKMLRKENAQGTINRKNTVNSASNFSEQENEEKIPLINQEKKSTTEHGSSIDPIPSIKKIAEHEEIHNAPASIAKQSPAASKTKAVDAITKTEEALLPAKGGALSISEKAQNLDADMRAEFQVSMNHWNSAQKKLALRHLTELISRQADFVPAHKHMFTDFAIQLRKINQHELALSSATRCTKLSPDDSHAFFNVSRLYYELGRYDEANRFIDGALELESNLEPALRLSEVIKECMRRKAKNR